MLINIVNSKVMNFSVPTLHSAEMLKRFCFLQLSAHACTYCTHTHACINEVPKESHSLLYLSNMAIIISEMTKLYLGHYLMTKLLFSQEDAVSETLLCLLLIFNCNFVSPLSSQKPVCLLSS